MGVDETEGGMPVRCGGVRVDGDRLVAGCLADGCDPLFPFAGVLWLLVGVQ